MHGSDCDLNNDGNYNMRLSESNKEVNFAVISRLV